MPTGINPERQKGIPLSKAALALTPLTIGVLSACSNNPAMAKPPEGVTPIATDTATAIIPMTPAHAPSIIPASPTITVEVSPLPPSKATETITTTVPVITPTVGTPLPLSGTPFAVPSATVTETVNPTAAATKEAAATPDAAAQARQEFNTVVVRFAPVLGIDPDNQIDKNAPDYYQQLEKSGWIVTLPDAQGNPAMFCVAKGPRALRPDVPQYFVQAADWINKHDPDYIKSAAAGSIYSMAALKVKTIITGTAHPDWGSYTEGVLLVPNHSVNGAIVAIDITPAAFNHGMDMRIEAIGRLLGEIDNTRATSSLGSKATPLKVEEQSYKTKMVWLNQHVNPKEAEYAGLKGWFDLNIDDARKRFPN